MGADAEQFGKPQTAYGLLKGSVRRRVYDDTGYDPQFADPRIFRGSMMLQILINEFVLENTSAATSIRSPSCAASSPRHRQEPLPHPRTRAPSLPCPQTPRPLGRRPETDVLGSMLRARSQSIADAIKHAYTMLQGQSYELEAIEVKARAAE